MINELPQDFKDRVDALYNTEKVKPQPQQVEPEPPIETELRHLTVDELHQLPIEQQRFYIDELVKANPALKKPPMNFIYFSQPAVIKGGEYPYHSWRQFRAKPNAR